MPPFWAERSRFRPKLKQPRFPWLPPRGETVPSKATCARGARGSRPPPRPPETHRALTLINRTNHGAALRAGDPGVILTLLARLRVPRREGSSPHSSHTHTHVASANTASMPHSAPPHRQLTPAANELSQLGARPAQFAAVLQRGTGFLAKSCGFRGFRGTGAAASGSRGDVLGSLPVGFC